MERLIRDELELIKSKGLYRRTKLVSGRQGSHVELDGRQVLMLCSNNYLGLADHSYLAESSIRAIKQYGTSSAASRLVSGTMELHELLEQSVSSFKGSEAALVFNSGYAANTGIIPSVAGRGDTVFSDRLNHASIVDGIILSGAKLVRYPHNDMNALASLLESKRGSGRCIIVTDGVFSMDGDIAPLNEIVRLKTAYDAILIVDDAHGCGVLGENGRGSAELLGAMDGIDIHVGTFGKALGSFGAYAALSAEMREYLINRARSFIFSTSLPPSVLAASVAALDLVASAEGRELRKKLQANTSYFRQMLNDAGFVLGDGTTQIVPIMVGEADDVMRFSAELLEEGLYVSGIRPPTVPAGACRLRCTIMATHSSEDLCMAAERITSVGKRLGVI